VYISNQLLVGLGGVNLSPCEGIFVTTISVYVLYSIGGPCLGTPDTFICINFTPRLGDTYLNALTFFCSSSTLGRSIILLAARKALANAWIPKVAR